jgi:predicted Zn-dependent protease
MTIRQKEKRMNRKSLLFVAVISSWLFLFPLEIIAQQTDKTTSIKPKKETKTDVIKHFRNYGSDSKDNKSGHATYEPEELKRNTYNYFRIDKTGRSLWNGKHWTPDDFPLTIFVKSSPSDYYKTLFRNYVDYALSVWEQADSRIQFKYVANTRDADIVIMFEESLVVKYDDNYLGITDYRLRADKKIQKSFIEIGLLKFNNEPVSDGEIKATIIHELGHALGLGHSDNETDIMFPFINPFSSSDMHFNELSGGDIEAVKSVVNLGFGFILN